MIKLAKLRLENHDLIISRFYWRNDLLHINLLYIYVE